jgi:chromosome segregation ATPase
MTDTQEPGRQARMEKMLDEIRQELGKITTDLAVLASSQPRIMEIVEDHERRIRAQEAVAPAYAAMSAQIARVESDLDKAQTKLLGMQAELDKNSWLPKLSWSILIGVISIIVGWGLSSIVAPVTP